MLRVDAFGNLITNFTAEDLPPAAEAGGKINLQVGGKPVENMVLNFSQGTPGEPVTLILAKNLLAAHFDPKNESLALEDYSVGDKKIPPRASRKNG